MRHNTKWLCCSILYVKKHSFVVYIVDKTRVNLRQRKVASLRTAKRWLSVASGLYCGLLDSKALRVNLAALAHTTTTARRLNLRRTPSLCPAEMQSRQSSARYHTFHGPKQQLLGNQAGHVAPAWRAGSSGTHGVAGPSGKAKQITNPGSKILLSRLPVDVPEKEVDVSNLVCIGHALF